MNGFGLEGAKALEEALRQNHTLLELNISYCRIPVEGAPHIAAGLENNDHLTHLDVSRLLTEKPIIQDILFAMPIG